MNVNVLTVVTAVLTGLLLNACSENPEEQVRQAQATIAAVDGTRIEAANREPGEWMAHGRTYSEERFSPLSHIDDGNVNELALAWSMDLETNRALEATPIIVDGVMYTTGSWSIVYAVDAQTGALIWKYDPEVPREWAINACCDAVNRGAAVWEGKVFAGTIDGRLIALNAEDGTLVWSENTIDRDQPYTITGAPRVVKGKVLIGNGGADYGVRGYISAYNTETGTLDWRFHTVPGDPADGFENDAMEMAAKTWNGEWWKLGGGGTVWDSMSYDPELNLLYVGVGNGSPWNQKIRSPGGGDNLFLASIVALNPDNGEYVWHYQNTPGDTWDYTATQHMILADLDIKGETRKVLMQAPKNGFFYILDRQTGELLSAEPYVPINWATHVDLETGRPVEIPGARYPDGKPYVVSPAPYGGHNWHPMSYSEATGLVYIPAHELAYLFVDDTEMDRPRGTWNLGIDLLASALPEDLAARDAIPPLKGHLAAWDPIEGKEVWRVQHKGPWNGGVLSTAGNLVFQGTADGRLVAYRADTGDELWSSPTHTGVLAAPVSYEIDGQQYISVMAGFGTGFSLVAGYFVQPESMPNRSRILTYKLGGEANLPAEELTAKRPVEWPMPPEATASAETVAHGKERYMRYCQWCHGDSAVSGGLIKDLRASAALHHAESWDAIVLDGVLSDAGMVSFKEFLSVEDADAVREYVIHEANKVIATASAD